MNTPRFLFMIFTLVVALWIVGGLAAIYVFDSLEQASNFGESFGAVSALVSSLALAMAIYSMILQQKQTEQFEQQTLGSLEQQQAAIALIQESLKEQASMARVSAITALIDREEMRIENLKQWGKQQGNPMKYDKGIDACSRRIEAYNEELMAHAKL